MPPLGRADPKATAAAAAAAGQQQQTNQHQHQAQVQQRINAFNAAAAATSMLANESQGNFIRVQQQQQPAHQESPHKISAVPRSSLAGNTISSNHNNTIGGRSDMVTKFIEMETVAGHQQQTTSLVNTTKRTIPTPSSAGMGSNSPMPNTILITRSNSNQTSNNNGKHLQPVNNNHTNNNNIITTATVFNQQTSSTTMSSTSSSSSAQQSRTVWHFATNSNSIENNSINNPSYMSVINNNNHHHHHHNNEGIGSKLILLLTKFSKSQ